MPRRNQVFPTTEAQDLATRTGWLIWYPNTHQWMGASGPVESIAQAHEFRSIRNAEAAIAIWGEGCWDLRTYTRAYFKRLLRQAKRGYLCVRPVWYTSKDAADSYATVRQGYMAHKCEPHAWGIYRAFPDGSLEHYTDHKSADAALSAIRKTEQRK